MTATANPITERDLLALCDKEIRLAETPSDVSNQRIKHYEYYLGRPYGRLAGKEGHSQLNSRMLMDVIEWALPILCKLFCGNPRAVGFTPVGPEDVKAADQETDYCSHVFWQENKGWYNLYCWLKDGLLTKNGYVKGVWDDKITVRQHEYEHLTEDQVRMLLSDPEVTPIAGDSYVERVEVDGISRPEVFYDLVVNHQTTKGRYELCPVPPEELRISNDCNGPFLDEARAVGHVRLVPRSDLVEMGISREVVDTLPTFGGRTIRDTREKRARHADVRSRYDVTYDQGEGQMAVVEVREVWIKVDWDGDGIAERRRVLYSGKTLLENEWVPHVPIYNWSPIMMSHRHVGISYGDVVEDLHEAMTVLTRQIFDNIYRTNNPETVVDVTKVKDPSEWHSISAGGVKRVTADPRTVFAERVLPFSAEKSFPVVEMLQGQRMERTGTGPDAIAQDPESLQNVNTGVAQQALSMAAERILQVARNFAECGLRSCWLGMHADLQRHQNQEKQVELSGDWVSVNPASWRIREHMRVNVGLGAGTSRDKLTVLGLILEQQKELYAGGGKDIIVTEKNIFNTLDRMVEAAELGNLGVEHFFRDPASPEALRAMQIKSQQQSEADKLAQMNREALMVDLQNKATDNIVKMEEVQRKSRRDRLDFTVATTEQELKYGTDVPGSSV